jgi:hypothetical protein
MSFITAVGWAICWFGDCPIGATTSPQFIQAALLDQQFGQPIAGYDGLYRLRARAV